MYTVFVTFIELWCASRNRELKVFLMSHLFHSIAIEMYLNIHLIHLHLNIIFAVYVKGMTGSLLWASNAFVITPN